MSEEQTNFKVTDRRLFNPDGSPRDVPPEEKPPLEPARAETSAAGTIDLADRSKAPTSAAVSAAPQPQPQETEEAQAELTQEEIDLPGADDPASFANFVMSIASNAASSLGMMEHPVTGKREVDLELGKHWIDVLGMLEQKTRGNLLPQEKTILENLLADLRMQYVSLTSGTASKAQTYSSRDITGG
jgi:hypothetical protein